MQIAVDVVLIIAGLCRDFGARKYLEGGSTKPQSIDTCSETKGPVPFSPLLPTHLLLGLYNKG